MRTGIVAFGLVVAYPYIPGSGSGAFKGVSIFLGVIFSLGSSSAISNIIAGYTMTYRRAFRVGDRVAIGEVTGDVSEIRLQVTHLHAVKNEEVVVPNSTILNSNVVNYSALARKKGLILHTTVGIGYETPWRQVEAMLILAAERTPRASLREPAPFVLETALGDFCITYEINVYAGDARAMASPVRGAPPQHPRRLQRVRSADHDPGLRATTPSGPRSCRRRIGGPLPRDRRRPARRPPPRPSLRAEAAAACPRIRRRDLTRAAAACRMVSCFLRPGACARGPRLRNLDRQEQAR